jgi:hypothetical protein
MPGSNAGRGKEIKCGKRKTEIKNKREKYIERKKKEQKLKERKNT